MAELATLAIWSNQAATAGTDRERERGREFLQSHARICHDLVYSVLKVINRFRRKREGRDGPRESRSRPTFFMPSVLRASNYRIDMELVKMIHEAWLSPYGVEKLFSHFRFITFEFSDKQLVFVFSN